MRLVAKKTEDRQRLTVGGHIRPGEKVLTKTAAANATAAKLYEQGVADGVPSNEIAAKITETTKLQNPLRPVNPPWFTVRSADFAMPEIAGWLMEKFGEDRGDGRHIYRFPVVFPVRDPDLVMPHTLAQYNASRELVRYCTEDPKTGAPMCMERTEVEMVNRKARRPPPGGRPFRTREWNGGICDPSSCPEYQADPPQCSLHGELIYAVPGAPGGHYIGTPINSWYSADQILRTLDRIAGIRGDVGIAGAREDGRPLFWLTKRQSVIGRIDR